MYYLCIENKGADQLHGYRAVDLRFVFAHAKSRFSHDTAHLFHHQEEEDYEPESPIAEVDEDIPSDDSLSPEESPRRDYSKPLVKPQDTIVLDFGGGALANKSKFSISILVLSVQHRAWFVTTCHHCIPGFNLGYRHVARKCLSFHLSMCFTVSLATSTMLDLKTQQMHL